MAIRQLRRWEECYNEVEQEDEDRQSIVQDILRKKHGLHEAGHRANWRSVSGVYAPRCHRFPLKLHLVRLFWTRKEAMQLVVCGVRLGASTLGRFRRESWSEKMAGMAEKKKCYERTLYCKDFARIWSMPQGHVKPTERFWQFNRDGGTGLSRERSARNNGQAHKVHHGRPWDGESACVQFLCGQHHSRFKTLVNIGNWEENDAVVHVVGVLCMVVCWCENLKVECFVKCYSGVGTFHPEGAQHWTFWGWFRASPSP